MGVVGGFVRRLLVQAVVSSTVMAGIQVAVRFGPEILPPQVEVAALDHSQAAGPVGAATTAPLLEHGSGKAFAQDRTSAGVKAGRFPAWRERMATVPTTPLERLASKGPGMSPGDVVLFDRCRPDCESRDPLLASKQHYSALPEPPPEPWAGLGTLPVAEVTDAAHGAELPRAGSAVGAAARNGVSWARRLVGTAGDVITW